jgi:uncharacterized protein (TIGR02145 family)
MKNIFFYFLVFSSFFASAQTLQNINKNTGIVSNSITTIDSIRFNGSSTNMEVVFQNGIVETHSISDIVNVNFVSANQHSCGADSIHNSNLSYGSMTDQEGNIYKTIVIGSQEWMAENLKTSTYRNGDPIATNLTDVEWGNTINTQLGAWAYLNNDSLYECPYGRLYNFFAVADPRHICPAGWHEPTDAEWSELINYLDPNADGGNNYNLAATKLKCAGAQYWSSPNSSATNESGFSGLAIGNRNQYGQFFATDGEYAYWWTSSEFDSTTSWVRFLNYNLNNAIRNVGAKQAGNPLRCLRD